MRKNNGSIEMMWSLSERFQREFCRKKYLFTLYRSCLLKWQSHDPRGRPVAYIHLPWLHLFGQEAVYDCNHRILLSWKQISWKTQAENSRKMQSQRSICFILFALDWTSTIPNSNKNFQYYWKTLEWESKQNNIISLKHQCSSLV